MTANSGVGTVGPEALEARADRRAPATDSEKYLAALWKELIGIDDVSVTDHFLLVGGNSLTLNIILNRIEKEQGVALPPQQFFDDERSSLFELARELDALRQVQASR